MQKFRILVQVSRLSAALHRRSLRAHRPKCSRSALRKWIRFRTSRKNIPGARAKAAETPCTSRKIQIGRGGGSRFSFVFL